MTALTARLPLAQLPMNTTHAQVRRLSARLREKEDAGPSTTGYQDTNQEKSIHTTSQYQRSRQGHEKAHPNKKRKIEYDEEVEGFAFTRAKSKKARDPTTKQPSPLPSTTSSAVEPTRENVALRTEQVPKDGDQAMPIAAKRKARNKMSFSTPKEGRPRRRSKRLSNEQDAEVQSGSPPSKLRPKERDKAHIPLPEKSQESATGTKDATPPVEGDQVLAESHSATKISLPFADTPVIRRNKAMREGKTGKGERRSSLGMRGRRASSLIESGTSNALPHSEVQITDFYKHIESGSLPEPRRMRQLLTWCATRAMGEKLLGAEFEDQSARMAARVIEEELLKDLANRSEMSDWFGREDVPPPIKPVVRKPNPKNVQNEEKIRELEAQIKRLQDERKALESLSQPRSIPPSSAIPSNSEPPTLSTLDKSMLSPSDIRALESLSSNPTSAASIADRINLIGASLQKTVDSFADGMHQLGQYRDSAERVASGALKACSNRLDERDRESRKAAEGDRSSRGDIGAVLRSLSRLER
ncbi:MAG: hypothetical protein Q9227_003853 [Pyrenula ochraceoflavens]